MTGRYSRQFPQLCYDYHSVAYTQDRGANVSYQPPWLEGAGQMSVPHAMKHTRSLFLVNLQPERSMLQSIPTGKTSGMFLSDVEKSICLVQS